MRQLIKKEKLDSIARKKAIGYKKDTTSACIGYDKLTDEACQKDEQKRNQKSHRFINYEH